MLTNSPFTNLPIVIIYGPTGVGKTDFALQLAREISGEIINMDVGQLYTPLTIGTAKPDWKSFSIPHHCFDLINEPRNFSVAEYRLMCSELIADIEKRGNVPILVGGSGFYLKSLFFPPIADNLNNKNLDNLNNNFDQNFNLDGLDNLDLDSLGDGDQDKKYWWDQLFLIDPIRALEIDFHDTYRVQRALTIWFKTDKKPSEFKPVFNPIAPANIIFLTRERKELYSRINERVDCMMSEGWLAEVESLCNTVWQEFIQKKKIIGYVELFDFLSKEKSEQDYNRIRTLATIKQKTRHYAKRQETFWRMFSKLCSALSPHLLTQKQLILSTINMTLPSKDVCFNELVTKLKK